MNYDIDFIDVDSGIVIHSIVDDGVSLPRYNFYIPQEGQTVIFSRIRYRVKKVAWLMDVKSVTIFITEIK